MIAPCVISLDLDDTLWPVEPVITAAESALLSWMRDRHPRAALGHDVGSMRRLRADVAQRFPERSHDLSFLRRRALAEQFAAAGYGDAQSADLAAEEAMQVFLTERNRVTFYEDARPALERLSRRYRLFAVSNGNADLARCGIAHLFHGHITASAAGAAKPDARIFAHLLLAAGAQPAQVMHVGDDPVADVAGAIGAGMQAVWLNRDGKPWPDGFLRPPRTVTTLAELM
jgi:putative hydrolase of the HAD superfamily